MFETTERTGASLTYGGASTALAMWGLSVSEWAVIISTLVAIGGFCIQLYHARRKEKRAQELHVAQLEGLRNGSAKNTIIGVEEDS